MCSFVYIYSFVCCCCCFFFWFLVSCVQWKYRCNSNLYGCWMVACCEKLIFFKCHRKYPIRQWWRLLVDSFCVCVARLDGLWIFPSAVIVVNVSVLCFCCARVFFISCIFDKLSLLLSSFAISNYCLLYNCVRTFAEPHVTEIALGPFPVRHTQVYISVCVGFGFLVHCTIHSGPEQLNHEFSGYNSIKQ